MEKIMSLFTTEHRIAALVVMIVLLVTVLFMLNRFLRDYWKTRKFQFQLLMLLLTLAAGVMVIIMLPFSDTLRGQLLTLLGVLLSAAIAFASTTFIGNILAGFMLRVIKNIKLGDYITVNDVTGRATEMSLLHVEVQTEKSDLVTIPNILMVTHPVKVVRSTGTIVSVDVSLGYDIARTKISELLSLAVTDAGLTDSFVQIRGLGDFSVTYRAAGQLKDISSLLSSQSNLYGCVLDRLHAANIEIVSPNFMNTRSVEGKEMIPKRYLNTTEEKHNGTLEKIVFEKAEMASSITQIEAEIERLTLALEAKEGALNQEKRYAIESKVQQLKIELKIKQEQLSQDQPSQSQQDNDSQDECK